MRAFGLRSFKESTEHAVVDFGHNAEDGFKAAGENMKRVFESMQWFGSGGQRNGADPASPQSVNRQQQQPAASSRSPQQAPAAAYYPHVPAASSTAVPSSSSRDTGVRAPAATNGRAAATAAAASGAAAKPVPAAGPAAPANDGDAAMRHYFLALERLTGMGYSPEASQCAMQHLDDWLASAAGRAVMSAAESAARSRGDPILHSNDRVRLEGMVKNIAANGKVGILQAYGAESQRWRVYVPDDDKVYWIKPKLLTPVQVHQHDNLLPDSESTTVDLTEAPTAARPSGESTSEESQALAAGWVKLEAYQKAWEEKRQLQALELETKEHRLRDLEAALESSQAQLEDERQALGDRRRTLAKEQAMAMSVLEQERQQVAAAAAVAPSSPGNPAALDLANPGASAGEAVGKRLTAEFVMHDDDDDSPVRVQDMGGDLASDGEAEQDDDDELWDMDWSAVTSQKNAGDADSAADEVFQRKLSDITDDSPVGAQGGGSLSPMGGDSSSKSTTLPDDASQVESDSNASVTFDPSSRQAVIVAAG
eukprot:TRINITY_DN29536_c0_g1_i1.p1 TRINITY_DN29536_c0_g1~~TRINITY_DN29536_c0_g1_i1.p1  ORF type:complete len:538 (-),score=153.37 TRINITY_DN29536_c0_g1_i1:104-1717(-)